MKILNEKLLPKGGKPVEAILKTILSEQVKPEEKGEKLHTEIEMEVALLIGDMFSGKEEGIQTLTG